MQASEIRSVLLEVVQHFPPEYIPGYTIDTVRTAFHISLSCFSSLLVVRCDGKTLMATSRPNRVSLAR